MMIMMQEHVSGGIQHTHAYLKALVIVWVTYLGA